MPFISNRHGIFCEECHDQLIAEGKSKPLTMGRYLADLSKSSSKWNAYGWNHIQLLPQWKRQLLADQEAAAKNEGGGYSLPHVQWLSFGAELSLVQPGMTAVVPAIRFDRAQVVFESASFILSSLVSSSATLEIQHDEDWEKSAWGLSKQIFTCFNDFV